MGNYLRFNGINSCDYGVIISGAGTYATPERDITSMSVPGRNGDLHFDNGRYNNIQITYPCGIAKGFEQKFLPFIRQLASAPIYSRLEDDYHPDEFRLATFHAELVPDVGTIMRSGHFELVFDCKPQRFLKAGEQTELTVTGTAHPSIVGIGPARSLFTSEVLASLGDDVLLDSVYIVFDLVNKHAQYGTNRVLATYPQDEVGDPYGYGSCNADPTSATTWNNLTGEIGVIKRGQFRIGANFYNGRYIFFTLPDLWEIYFTPFNQDEELISEPYSDSAVIYNPTAFDAKPILKIHKGSSAFMNKPVCLVNGNGQTIRMSFPAQVKCYGEYFSIDDIFIDCDTMNAYSIVDGVTINMNADVTLPGKPIVLNPGHNTIYTNNFAGSVSIVPMWWRL